MMKRARMVVMGLLLVQTLLAGADRLARVDAEGVLRWTDTGDEVALLGVNYYTPFTIDHAALKRLGLDHRQVMRDDVAHFRRLGLGCIRVHCFERQFSDREGNLLDNEHLALLDELIDVRREQGSTPCSRRSLGGAAASGPNARRASRISTRCAN